jgi:hypothetical protein
VSGGVRTGDRSTHGAQGESDPSRAQDARGPLRLEAKEIYRHVAEVSRVSVNEPPQYRVHLLIYVVSQCDSAMPRWSRGRTRLLTSFEEGAGIKLPRIRNGEKLVSLD